MLVFSGSALASSSPSIESESATNITSTNATLEAQINPQGRDTGYEFQIDTNGSYHYTQPACPPIVPGSVQCMAIIVGESLLPGLVEPPPGEIPAATGDRLVSVDLAGIGTTLQPSTTYHFRVIASNGGQIVEGPDRTFTTTPKTKSKLLTRAQKFARALKACKGKRKRLRASCKKLARERYGASGKHVR